MIDGHCHILPGCDDGSPDMDYSVKMLEAAKASGIDSIIFTPHTKGNFADKKKQERIYKKIIPIADTLGINTTLGTEVHWKKLAELDLKDLRSKTLGNSNLFLIEFSLNELPYIWKKIIEDLKAQDLKVVIAHPERYVDIQEDYDIAKQMKDLGCMFMLSATFIHPNLMGWEMSKTAKKMIKDGFADMIASDAHSVENYTFIGPAIDYAINHGYNLKSADKILYEAF